MSAEAQLSIEKVTVLEDYMWAVRSREASYIGRREVMSGKAKFGIFGDGKELPQIALAKVFQPGDWRSGYYRDQTLMFALGVLTVQQFFAQLYAHASLEADPVSGGRQMNGHFGTRFIDEYGDWLPQVDRYNSSADVSPTGSQMPRLVGLGYASRLYRELDELSTFTRFSDNGNEVAFGTIGNASAAEGMFWEAINAIGVLGGPVVLSIWDDEYGISVSNEHQVTKRDLSGLLQGFQRDPEGEQGFDIYTVKGWDYPALIETFQRATRQAREHHIPAIVHVIEVTQPQGHSTSGSHERYKSSERLAWEAENDCLVHMRKWILQEGYANSDELDQIEAEAKKYVEEQRTAAWKAFTGEFLAERRELDVLLQQVEAEHVNDSHVANQRQELMQTLNPQRKDIMKAARRTLFYTRGSTGPARRALAEWTTDYKEKHDDSYGRFLYCEDDCALNIAEVKPVYDDDAPTLPGFQVLNANFDAIFARYPHVIAFGEDVGHLGGVNQALSGLQEKYGKYRVSDTGIREATIIGQAIGMAMRGLRPIAEIQYLDYLLYALQIMSDDLATVQWRSVGGQKAPVIIRTRGHRLEGVWHSGSPMAGIIHLVRGMHVLVPRNMTQAAGMYNTLLQSDEPGLIVEVLNGYRLHEKLPSNPGEFTVPLGVPEVVREGQDITLVTYGANVRIALEAANILSQAGIEVEVIDVRTLLPFDIHCQILKSLKKTNHIIFLDEDVPGGASAFMMEQVLEKHGGFWHLDSMPRTVTAKAHRPAYGSDGNYFSKPGVEDVLEAAYDLMSDVDPGRYPAL